MSADTVIQLHDLGKRYHIAHQRAEDVGLRHLLNEAFTAPLRWLRGRDSIPSRKLGGATEEFWALRNVTLGVERGEVLGVIGRNGAGKSTLLKLLSQITEPTEGRIHIRGRVASLLEVGTGFHPELTGRENIYLNGAILGMSRAEIRRKFDEIVEFSEVHRFLDTPVKRYSSGMYVRLAFAVAAHLEPEILVVDEVLAVGDAQFQKKCLGKMSEVSHLGRTVLFVSHNMQAVAKLCSKGVVLDRGRVAFLGGAREAISRYHVGADRLLAEQDQTRAAAGVGPNEVRFLSWELVQNELGLPHVCYSREECRFRFTLVCRRKMARVHFGFVVRSADDTLVISGHNLEDRSVPPTLDPGTYWIEWQVRLPLAAGLYRVEIAANEETAPGRGDTWQSSQRLEVVESRFSSLPEQWRGIVSEPVAFSMSLRREPISEE